MKKLLTKRNANLALGLVILITVVLGYFVPQLRLSYDFEKFFPEHDKQLDFYYAHREKFETDNDFLLIAIKPKEGVFSPVFLEKLDSLTNQLRRVEHVEGSFSLTNYRLPILTPIGWNSTSPIDYTDVAQLPLDSARLMLDQNVKGSLLSTDGKTAVVMIRNTPNISKKKSDKLLSNVDKIVNAQHFDEIHISGKVHGQYHYIKKMAEELLMFTAIAIVLLSVFLYITFRTGWGIWVPLLIVGVTIIWLMGFIAMIGEELNMLCTILPTIIFVVGIADSVHILEKFVHELRHGYTKIEALVIAYEHVGFATLLTAVTNAIGFVTLLISDIEPIRTFGVFTALGILFAFLLTYLLLPAALLYLPTPKVAALKHSETFWHRILPKLFTKVMRRRKLILFSSLAICIVSVIAATQIKINNFLLEDWSEDDPIKKDYVFLEKNFSGVRPFEMSIEVKDPSKDLFDPEVMKELDKLDTYLRKDYGVGAIISPLVLMKTLNRSAHGGDEAYYKLPDTEDEYENIRPFIKKSIKNGKVKTYISKDKRSSRISGRLTDYGGYVLKQKNAELENFIQKNIDPKVVSFQQTGMAMLIDRNNENLSNDIGYELGLSLLMVAGIMGLLFRNVRIVLIALIPNLVPLLVVAGYMGSTGIDLKISTSLIFSIAFGIAVDDTIHFMSNLKLELNKGKSPIYALKSTYLSTGKAVTITNLILLSGFFSLILSTFAGTFYLGLLVSITLLVALIAELTLMPILFVWIYGTTHAKGRNKN